MRSFIGIAQQSYIGQLYALPAQTINTKFGRQNALPPTTIATLFNWTNYGASTAVPNVNALVQLQPAGARQILDKILSVRVDNLGNNVPVYIYFPDTNYTVVAPPNTVVWEPVETGQFAAWVIGEGFTTGNIGTTAVYFCNFKVPPFIDNEFPQSSPLWLASATISRGATIYNQNYGTPALGDQTINYNIALGTGVRLNNMWGTPYTGGFLYLTHIDLTLSNMSVFNGVTAGTEFVLESTGSAGILYDFSFSFPNGTGAFQALPVLKLLNFSGMNVKLDATQTWRIRGISNQNWNTGPTLLASFNFTLNPQ